VWAIADWSLLDRLPLQRSIRCEGIAAGDNSRDVRRGAHFMLHLVSPTQGSKSHEPFQIAARTVRTEAARLVALEAYGILDTAPEPAFDRITEMAADLLEAPIALLGFTGHSTVFFKSHHGVAATHAPRAADLSQPALAPWIGSEFRQGFHVEVPLYSFDGSEIGMLCVIDRRPRRMEERQKRHLWALGGIATDLLALRLAARRVQAQAEIITSEVDHRAMNSLQFVTSLLQLQSRASGIPEVKRQLGAAANRVLSVARLHRTFSTQETAECVPIVAHLRGLCEELSASVGSEIRLGGTDEVEVPKAQVLPIGLIVNELATNARKHAGSPVTITFHRRAEGAYELCVLDEGPGLPAGFDAAAPSGLGLGMKVVNALVAQLQGTLTTHANPIGRGSCFKVTFPVG
jgi:two-component sensor histidine kinase